MNEAAIGVDVRSRVIGFLWQHVLLFLSLFVMTAGVALCVRSALGSSVISTIPYVMTEAGGASMAPGLTIGQYTYLMNFVLVLAQIAVLRRRFEAVQLFQLVIGWRDRSMLGQHGRHKPVPKSAF